MIELIALSSEDGWAFLRHQAELRLVRPPYQRWNLLHTDEATLQRALQDHGFVTSDDTFPSWAALIAHLKERLLAERQARGRSLPDSRAIRELVHRAPAKVLQRFLDRVENELLPGRERQAAFELLTHLLAVETVKKKPEFYDRALNLLQRCRLDAAAQSHLGDDPLVDERAALEALFPRAVTRYGADELLGFAQRVSRRQQILAFGT